MTLQARPPVHTQSTFKAPTPEEDITSEQCFMAAKLRTRIAMTLAAAKRGAVVDWPGPPHTSSLLRLVHTFLEVCFLYIPSTIERRRQESPMVSSGAKGVKG